MRDMKRMMKNVAVRGAVFTLASSLSVCAPICAMADTDVSVAVEYAADSSAEGITPKDGTYTISTQLWKAKADEKSMAAATVAESATLVVKDGTYTITITTQPMTAYGVTAYLKALRVYSDSDKTSYTDAEVTGTDSDGNPTGFKFTVASLTEFINVGTDSGRGSYSDARLKMDYSGVETVDDETSKKDESTKNNESAEEISETDTLKKIEDGTYSADVYLWHATNDTESMAASAVAKRAIIVAENGNYVMHITTQPMTLGTITASLQEIKIQEADGNYTDAQVESKDSDGNPTGFYFTLPSLDEYLAVKVNPHVAMMGNSDIDARLKVDYSTLTAVVSDEKSEENDEVSDDAAVEEGSNDENQAEDDKDEVKETQSEDKVQTGDKSGAAAYLGLGIAAAGLGLISLKKKKPVR